MTSSSSKLLLRWRTESATCGGRTSMRASRSSVMCSIVLARRHGVPHRLGYRLLSALGEPLRHRRVLPSGGEAQVEKLGCKGVAFRRRKTDDGLGAFQPRQCRLEERGGVAALRVDQKG